MTIDEVGEATADYDESDWCEGDCLGCDAEDREQCRRLTDSERREIDDILASAEHKKERNA